MNYKLKGDFFIKKYLDQYKIDLEELAKDLKPEDVFRCEHGIKQIQNLHLYSNSSIFNNMLNTLNWYYRGIEIMNMQYFVKHPNYKITSPHQDGAYFDNPDAFIYTCWIPLQDVNEENSCLNYYKGNLDKVQHHESVGTTLRTRTGKTGVSQYSPLFAEEYLFEPIPMEFGDMVIHDQFAMHYAGINKTQIPRVALTVIFKSLTKLF